MIEKNIRGTFLLNNIIDSCYFNINYNINFIKTIELSSSSVMRVLLSHILRYRHANYEIGKSSIGKNFHFLGKRRSTRPSGTVFLFTSDFTIR